MSPAAPPRSATRVIGWLLAERDKEALIGDLSVVVLMRMDEAATFWYQVGLVITGPSASLTGGRLRS
jgi:hypothetical protein